MVITTRRLESFSDNVISIIITIMVFEIRFPGVTEHFTHWDVWMALRPLAPRIIVYLVTFIVLGIMWVNHHHMFHLIQKVDEKLLWLNLHFLFWMSLIPFPTSMLGGNPFLPEACMMYAIVMLMNSIAFRLMRTYVERHDYMYKEGDDGHNKDVDAVNKKVRLKNLVGIIAYLISIPLAYVSIYLAYGCFLVLPAMFFIPDGTPDERQRLKRPKA